MYNDLIEMIDMTLKEKKTVLQAREILTKYACKKKYYFTETEYAYDYFKMHLSCLNREHFMVAYLRNDLSLITADLMFTGDATGVYVENIEIARRALTLNANHIIMGHNHPSGKSCPSEMDIQLTREAIEVLKQFGIGVVDHIIIGSEPYSMYQNSII